ncbi:MAG: class I SAM-dependent methyltransferase [Rhodoferax sp.]|uniref:class I SAM-dependent methyltransferase n=1 Tax=Rhodoferax sp. TaxID=50421 RepID=UPI0027276897|nr:class I SAM-dependent methyltransferase [Rhodoferax sp.]MDO8448283.1 class I SAM-dependent methyltransferase [Rhodoferax sp.]
MSDNLPYTVVEGIRCFSPEVASSYADYPDGGFDLTDKSGESSFWVRSRNRLFKSIVYDQMAPTGKTKFLEIGCGTGGFIQQIVENENLEITGSEIYLKGLLYAKKNLPHVDFIQFDVTQGEIGEKFDIIVAFDVIEHIEDDVAAISNINKMLHKGGVLIMTVPQHMFLWSKLDEIVKHKRRYSRRELITKLQENGFDISYSTSFLFMLFPLMLISRIFDKGRDQSQSDEVALEKRVVFSNALNWIFDHFMRIDEALIRLGISLPFGGTLVIIARKR